MELKSFLIWLTTLGAGLLARWIMGKINTSRWDAELANVGYLASIGMGYAEMPTTIVMWIERCFAVGTSAFGLGDLLGAGHAAYKSARVRRSIRAVHG